MNCEQLAGFVNRYSLISGCDVVRNDTLRIATQFRYPNGSQIDLFLVEQEDQERKYLLSDFGQTTEYLLEVAVKPWSTKKRQQVVADICRILQIEQEGGQLQVSLTEAEMASFPEAIVRLAQACIRMSDLINTQKFQPTRTFNEEVEEFISAVELPYDSNVALRGAYGKDVKVDYYVKGRRTESLVQTLSTQSTAAAHSLATETFRKWYDLSNYHSKYSFLSIFDTTNDVLREDDVARLQDVSTVVGFPAQVDDLQVALAA